MEHKEKANIPMNFFILPVNWRGKLHLDRVAAEKVIFSINHHLDIFDA